MIFHDHTPRQRSCTFSFLLRKGAGSWLGSFFAGVHFFQHPSGFRILCGLGFRLQVIRFVRTRVEDDSIGEDISKSVVIKPQVIAIPETNSEFTPENWMVGSWKVSFWVPGWDGLCSGADCCWFRGDRLLGVLVII